MLTPSPFARQQFVVRRGCYGLGAPCIDDPTIDCGDPGTVTLPTTPDPTASVSLPSTGTPTASSGGGIPSWLANIFTGAARTTETIALQQTNPLLQKGVYYQTPQGAIYAGNAPATGFVPGLTTTTAGLGSMLPILLIGGVLLMFMSRR
jgi:hypothetical protein